MLPEKPPEPLLLEAMALVPCGDALDLGCGTGRHTRALAAGGWRVTAVDSSQVALERLAGVNARIIKADLEAGEWQIEAASYDLICDTCFLYRPLFPHIRDGLRPGGLFVGVFPLDGINPEYLIKPGELPGHFAGWDLLFSAERSSGSGRMRAEIIARKPVTFRG
jgi:SAM-dependent methyltransferase